MSNEMRPFLTGKTIAVTGAAGRLGRHLVSALATSGADVAAIVMNWDEAKLLPSDLETRIESFIVDVTDPKSVVEGFDAIADRFSGLDGLIHTVGGWAMTPVLDANPDEWERLMRLNVGSAFLCFQSAARLMAVGSGGSLVAIASGQGADRGVGGQGAYSAAKAGVVRLVEAAAEELAESGIRALAVAPSMILFDPDSKEKGVHVADVVDACLSGLDANGPESGSVVRVYGTLV